MTDDRFDANKWYTQKKPVSVSPIQPKTSIQLQPIPPTPPTPPQPAPPRPASQKNYLSTVLIILSILAVIIVAIILIVLVDPFSENYAATVSEIVNKINFAEQFENIRFN